MPITKSSSGTATCSSLSAPTGTSRLACCLRSLLSPPHGLTAVLKTGHTTKGARTRWHLATPSAPTGRRIGASSRVSPSAKCATRSMSPSPCALGGFVTRSASTASATWSQRSCAGISVGHLLPRPRAPPSPPPPQTFLLGAPLVSPQIGLVAVPSRPLVHGVIGMVRRGLSPLPLPPPLVKGPQHHHLLPPALLGT